MFFNFFMDNSRELSALLEQELPLWSGEMMIGKNK